jgi:hypothetical protein
MTSDPFVQLTARLDRLDRANRRLRQALALVVLTLTTAGVVGAVQKAPPKLLEAERFILRGEGGKILAALCVEDGSPGLQFFDEKGKERAFVGLDEEAPVIQLKDPIAEENPGLGIELKVNKFGAASIFLQGPGGGSAAITAAGDPEHSAGLSLAPGEVEQHVWLYTNRSESFLRFTSENQVKRVEMDSEKDGATNIILRDKTGKLLKEVNPGAPK